MGLCNVMLVILLVVLVEYLQDVKGNSWGGTVPDTPKIKSQWLPWWPLPVTAPPGNGNWPWFWPTPPSNNNYPVSYDPQIGGYIPSKSKLEDLSDPDLDYVETL